jgi:hypothetical protein
MANEMKEIMFQNFLDHLPDEVVGSVAARQLLSTPPPPIRREGRCNVYDISQMRDAAVKKFGSIDSWLSRPRFENIPNDFPLPPNMMSNEEASHYPLILFAPVSVCHACNMNVIDADAHSQDTKGCCTNTVTLSWLPKTYGLSVQAMAAQARWRSGTWCIWCREQVPHDKLDQHVSRKHFGMKTCDVKNLFIVPDIHRDHSGFRNIVIQDLNVRSLAPIWRTARVTEEHHFWRLLNRSSKWKAELYALPCTNPKTRHRMFRMHASAPGADVLLSSRGTLSSRSKVMLAWRATTVSQIMQGFLPVSIVEGCIMPTLLRMIRKEQGLR